MDFFAYYLENDSKRLKNISDGIILKHFAWLPQMYYDDFYSIAGEVLWKCVEQYNDSLAQFETFLINCLIKKFKTRITYLNRQRRNNGISDASLDALIEDNDICLIDLIASEDKVEIDSYSDKMIDYLSRLSKIHKQILFAMADGYTNEEIIKHFKITPKEFSDACETLKSYRNVSLLY